MIEPSESAASESVSFLVEPTPRPYDPMSSIGPAWSIIGEYDMRSFELKSVDIRLIVPSSVLQHGEKTITNRERFNRVKERSMIRIDPRFIPALQALFKKKREYIPRVWVEGMNGKPLRIHFDGLVVGRDAIPEATVALVYDEGVWTWYLWPMTRNCTAEDYSALYPSRAFS